jgi:hypothetical protein
LRGRGPLMVFRGDKIKQDRLAGRSFNPCSGEYWREVKAEFAALTPDRLDDLQSRAANSRVQAADARRVKRQRGLEAACAAPVLAIADAQPQPPPRPAHALVPLRPARCIECAPGNGDGHCHRAMSLNMHTRCFDEQRNVRDLAMLDTQEATQAASSCPSCALTPEALRSFRDAKKKPIRDIVRDFDAQVSQGPRALHGGGVPKIVRHQRCCGELCRTSTPAPAWSVYCGMLAGFAECAQRFKSCADLLREDAVFAIEAVGFLIGIFKVV